MATMSGPAARLQIARYLTALRERAQMTLAEVAKAASCSTATVGRYEDWQNRARLTVSMVRAVAEACGATEQEREVLTGLVKTQGEGWWVDDPAVPDWMDPLVSIETVAEYEHVYANGLVPGLLQTRDYGLATHQASEVRAEPDDIERKVDARLRRQDILKRSDFHLWVILDESVLWRIVGSPSVMAGQVSHLQKMAKRPNVDIQILPYTAGASAAGSGGHFVILGKDDERQPLNSMSVVYLEMHRRGLYLDDPDELQSYKLTFAYLRSQAADPTASRNLLAAKRTEYSR